MSCRPSDNAFVKTGLGVHATASKKLRGPMMESSTKPGRMPAVSTRTTAALLVVVAVAHLALGRAHNHLSLASDDNLWLYVTGASLNRSAQVAGLQDRVLNSMRENNVAASTLVRIEPVITCLLSGVT